VATEKSQANVAILRSLLDALGATSPLPKQNNLLSRRKTYGADLSSFKTPAREDDPRQTPPNLYYEEEEDFLRERQQGKQWYWIALRPEAVCGFTVVNPMNLAMVIAVYAVLSKEPGFPLGSPEPKKQMVLCTRAPPQIFLPEPGVPSVNGFIPSWMRWLKSRSSATRRMTRRMGLLQQGGREPRSRRMPR